jgi:type VI secretion system protein ImpC
MCISRFAHFLKVMVRNKVGSFMERDEMERWLTRWINNYCTGDQDLATLSDESKSRKPLKSAFIEVQDVPGQPGVYKIVSRLQPHLQLEGVDISLRLVARQLKQ